MPTPTVPLASVAHAAPTDRTASTRFTTAMRRAGQTSATMPDSVWVPLVSGTLILAAGAMSLATGRPWLFPALGPTALLIAVNPGHPTTRFHSIVVGHVVAFACGWLAVLLLGAGDGGRLFMGGGLTVTRVWAGAFAVAVTAFIQPSLRAYHPPAAATALLVALGAYRSDLRTTLSLLAGVAVVALLGEWFQRLRLRDSTGRIGSGPSRAE
ncbi:MAG: HPP family protein [Gemmatimonadaceae bacterium]|nr:HPP family protein [Gemmatimonadaceae bacterium]